MNLLRILSFALLGLTPAAHAGARLGDTLAGATARYGAATERPAAPPATLARSFIAKDLVVEADFIHDAIHRISYRRPRAFTEEEIQKILAENAGAYAWIAESSHLNPVRDAAGHRSWLRSDRGSATLTRRTEGEKISETLVLTDAAWLMANLKLKLEPSTAAPTPPATPPTAAPAPATNPAHSLSWTNYDGVHEPASAHLVLDNQDLGSGASGLVELKRQLASLPAKTQVKVVPYYGDPGGATPRQPPVDLAELRAYCETHGLDLLIPLSR